MAHPPTGAAAAPPAPHGHPRRLVHRLRRVAYQMTRCIGGTLARVGRTTSTSAQSLPDFVVGERHSGTGRILDYDIVTGLGGTPRVAAHREVYHGAIKVYPGQLIDDYQAEYPHGEPNCCPSYIQQTVVLWDSAHHQFVSGPGHQYAPTVSFPTDPF